MIETILFTIAVVCTGAVSYMIGKSVYAQALECAKADLVTERAVRHNLNCLVGDLKHEFQAQEKVFKGAVMEAKRLDGLLHDQNVKVLELRNSLKVERDSNRQARADAKAYNQFKGVWCTDNASLIRHHAKKEQFFRLGYPEHKL